MDNLNVDTVDDVADEVARLTHAAMAAIERISRTACDEACAEAARLAIGAALLGLAMTSEEQARVVNEVWKARGWYIVRLH